MVAVGVDLQPLVVGGRADQVDDDLVAGQWPTAPVQGDGGEQPVFDLVPFGGAGREVAYGDGDAGAGGEPAEFDLPQLGAVTVGATGIGGDQQAGGGGIAVAADHVPPASDRGRGEAGGVVV